MPIKVLKLACNGFPVIIQLIWCATASRRRELLCADAIAPPESFVTWQPAFILILPEPMMPRYLLHMAKLSYCRKDNTTRQCVRVRNAWSVKRGSRGRVVSKQCCRPAQMLRNHDDERAIRWCCRRFTTKNRAAYRRDLRHLAGRPWQDGTCGRRRYFEGLSGFPKHLTRREIAAALRTTDARVRDGSGAKDRGRAAYCVDALKLGGKNRRRRGGRAAPMTLRRVSRDHR